MPPEWTEARFMKNGGRDETAWKCVEVAACKIYFCPIQIMLLSSTRYQGPNVMPLFCFAPFEWKKTGLKLMSGSTVHDLFPDEIFVRAPHHLLEHYTAVKPLLSSKTPPIKQQDSYSWRVTCVGGMQFFLYLFFYQSIIWVRNVSFSSL